MPTMRSVHDLPAIDEQHLPADVVEVLPRMRQHIEQQARQIEHKSRELNDKADEIKRKDSEIERKEREITWRDAKLEKIHLELARLRRWKFGAKTEAMTALGYLSPMQFEQRWLAAQHQSAA